MSISALPPSTARLLGSSSAIADPLSLVKELVDNSIDAGATSIEVNTTPNTVDRIQVRDNGRGIPLEDHDFLGRQAHTSKLRNFDELEFKGGKTLGFRGEALASANSLATIKITTRTAKDPVASFLSLKYGIGGIDKKQPVSGPQGTTVQALKLFENIPVRRQTALKQSRKTLANIKKLLEGYALALPHLKLSFKAPGDSCQPWSYSPCSSLDTREAITQVFGHALVTQLVEVSSSNAETGSIANSSETVILTAFLPIPESEAKIVKGKGAFISVDSRPISFSTGTGKKLFNIFKSSLSRASNTSVPSRSLPSPFMQLSIKCQPGSYDPNVSPLKDEVLFKDEPAILACFQYLCDKVYGEKALMEARKNANQNDQRNVCSTIQTHTRSPVPQTRMTLRSSRGQPHNGTQQGTNAQLRRNDQELLDALNDRFEKVLELSSNKTGGSHAAPSAPVTHSSSVSNTTSTLIQEEATNAGEPQTVQTKMRTKLMVNLSRKESNSSDMDGTQGLVPVRVTQRRVAPSKDQRSRLESPPVRLSEDIGRYFRPKRVEPIEIATDETATPENVQNLDEPTSNIATGRYDIRRHPLKELTPSDLNALQDEDDEDQADNEAAVDFSVTVLDTAPSRNLELPDEITTLRRVALPPSVNISSRPTRYSALQPEEPSSLQTPPSSDPARDDHMTRPYPSRYPVNGGLTRGQRPSQTTVRQSTDRMSDHGLRQSQLILENGQLRSQNRRRVQQTRHGNELASRRNTLILGHDDADAHIKDLLHNSHAHAEHQEG
ncbi:hypothetical protein NM208_g12095 [Fusarium decemcellulare]|uniref:Uncharacterized protein n=1 Tax=Fusarium decemcellulare TaxID=57161 RepID=A0ACC1RRV4_9HYPO|nr:hypothetical protein NM208_g12095 [Fusarium decemcellulare]